MPHGLRRSATIWTLLGLAAVSALAQDETPLPRSLAPHELGLPLPEVVEGPPPAGPVDTPAEYEHSAGLLIAWEQFNDVLSAITVAVTTHIPPGTIWVVVDDTGEQGSATAVLTAAGADLDHVRFLVRTTDSVWIRDYGPRFVFERGRRAIVDHVYNRPRPNDDVLPDYIAQQWGMDEYFIPLTHGGGNFHLFADGDAFMTDLVLDENPGLDAADVEQLFADFEAVDLTIWPGFPTSFDSTQHIDMWLLPVRDKVAIVGEYDVSTGQPHTITEAAVAELQGRGYQVFRTPGWRSGGTHYTYTNAVVFNDLVLLPEYNGFPSENAQALAVFQAAFPQHAIVQIDSSSLVTFAGVLHCIVMQVPDGLLFRDGFESGDFTAWSSVAQ